MDDEVVEKRKAKALKEAKQVLEDIKRLVEPCTAEWQTPPHYTAPAGGYGGEWGRFSIRITFLSGYKVTIRYWYHDGRWTR